MGSDTLHVEYWTNPNTFEGGAGNDTMIGGHNADTYRFNLGDGADTISDYQSHAQSGINDRIVFGVGIAAADIRVSHSGSDMVLAHVNGRDRITV